METGLCILHVTILKSNAANYSPRRLGYGPSEVQSQMMSQHGRELVHAFVG